MSPLARRLSATAPSFPRVSGDEPGNPTGQPGGGRFSPRERG